MLALVDGNNFFVSCERAFNPSLAGKPVIVVSSNDGCAVSRSNEAKALGIEMAVPLFKLESLAHHHKVKVLSSNFALYGDMSQRMMGVLQTFTPAIEVYSIDEAFLDFSGFNKDLGTYAQGIRQTVHQWLGLPISIGIAPTKTLAKVANKLAKQQANGICLLQSQADIDLALKTFPVQDLWGIGRQLGKSLRERAIYTAYEFKNLDPSWVRKKYTVVGERILRELNGLRCLSLEEVAPPKKSIQVSRSFGRNVTTLDDIKEAVATHLSSLAEKLRNDGLLAGYVSIYIQNSPLKKNHISQSAFKIIDPPSNDTHTLLKTLLPLTAAIFQNGIDYKKAGVMGCDLRDHSSRQPQMLRQPEVPKSTLGSVNKKLPQPYKSSDKV